MLIAAGLHVWVLFGFNGHPKTARGSPLGSREVIQISMVPEEQITEEAPVGTASPKEPSGILILPSTFIASRYQSFEDLLAPAGEFATSAAIVVGSLELPPVQFSVPKPDFGQYGRLIVYYLDELDLPPVPVIQIAPLIPPHLIKKIRTETVVLRFVVNMDGKVSDVYVAGSSFPGLDRVAVAAVEQWKFRPGKKAGRYVNTRVELPIIFHGAGTDSPLSPN